jgi:hypothetical protein
MAGLIKVDPLDFINTVKERCTHIVCLESAIDEERWHPDKMHFARYVPVFAISFSCLRKGREVREG